MLMHGFDGNDVIGRSCGLERAERVVLADTAPVRSGTLGLPASGMYHARLRRGL